ncbi:hypothetical protein EI555_016717, partial [Monodon monoceros]
ITCPTPTSVKHADIWVKSYNLNSRERYVCNSGFKRKAGTSSLTECVFNKTVNIAHWTTPNLKCIRDPSLTHQRPPSTAAPTGVTPEPDSPNPSGKGAYQYNPRAVTAAISTSVAVLCGVCVVCLLTQALPCTLPVFAKRSVGAERSLSQACALHFPKQPAGHWSEPGSQKPTDDTGPIHRKPIQKERRQAYQIPSVEMESMEVVPMTGGTDARGEGTENESHDPEGSRGRRGQQKPHQRGPREALGRWPRGKAHQGEKTSWYHFTDCPAQAPPV